MGPPSIRHVTELPDTGESGVLYVTDGEGQVTPIPMGDVDGLEAALDGKVSRTGNETIGMLKTTSLVTAVPFTLELQFATNAIANRIYKPIPLLLVACFWYLLITSILMVVQSRLEAHFGKGFNARPVGTKGKQPPYDPPYPGKSDGEPKDDVNKINQTTFAGLNA